MKHRLGGYEVWVAVISHKRPENVFKIRDVINCEPTYYINKGEKADYHKAGADMHQIVECGTNICEARNQAIMDAHKRKLPCIQVSDDLRGMKIIKMVRDGKEKMTDNVMFSTVVNKLCAELFFKGFHYGGVAVSSNQLNYTGEDTSYHLLLVNDLICIMPTKQPTLFDPTLALKEDYDLTIRELIYTGGVVRLNNILCNFPHRENKGGANTYRNSKTEMEATKRLKSKWDKIVKDNPRRPGQVLLNYKFIKQAREGILGFRKS